MKKYVLLVIMALFLSVSVASAAQRVYYEDITVADVAIGLTSANLAYFPYYGQVSMFCTVETASVRVRWDGTSPTSSIGHLYNATDTLPILTSIGDLKNFRAIRTGSSATLRCTYECSE